MLKYEVAEHVAIITLDNPPLNTFTRQTHDEIERLFRLISQDDDVEAVIFTGAGSKIFSAGQDVNEIRDQGLDETKARRRAMARSMQAILECSKPVIGAVNGIAVGAGVIMLSACDVLVCSHSAKFRLPEINVGVIGGARPAMRMFPLPVVRYLCLTGEALNAADAYRLGAVAKLVEEEQLMSVAMSLAEKLREKSPRAIEMWKQTLRDLESMSLLEGTLTEQERSLQLQASADSREAAAAFLEKRQPNYNNRIG